MKKLLLISLSLLILACLDANAQVQKSDQNLGFGFDINSLSGDGAERRTNLYLSYTYFLSNRISLGVGPRFGWNKSTQSTEDPTTMEVTTTTSKTSTIGYNGFINYSFLTDGGFILPYFGGQFTRLIQKQPGTDDIVTDSYGGNVGIKFFITERLNVDNNFSITRVIAKSETISSNGVPIQLDLDGTIMQINVGLGYIIGRKN
ncbi:outer membrane beta-barrel protein [Ekhidna sp.]|jgi:hypothetical protein|uniref:outer membrane beta-barrel protein n=1 Tax=Ekhidna sp. TaxID=2608089 RepID=UPI0032ED81C0